MILYKREDECTACGACLSICSKQAIKFVKNEYGFLYPHIDETKCINCGMCTKVCDTVIESLGSKYVQECYFAVSKDTNTLQKSSSGGVFALLAQYILKSEGVVFGACIVKNEDEFDVRHIEIDTEEELYRIQGSKYVFSRMGDTYCRIKEILQSGKTVLFCGTPCQIAGLKRYLLKKYDNLYTIDLVCHGTPSLDMFNSFMKYYQLKNNLNILDVNFREKIKNVDSTSLFYLKFITESSEVKKYCKTISYYGYFLNGNLYRESCYNCKYACKDRVGDITLGDGWGFERYYPEMLMENGGKISQSKGISTVLVNSEKGKGLFELIKEDMNVIKTNFETVSEFNHQLKEPTKKKNNNDELMKIYQEKGYAALDTLYFRNMSVKDKFFNFIFVSLKVKIPQNGLQFLRNIRRSIHMRERGSIAEKNKCN